MPVLTTRVSDAEMRRRLSHPAYRNLVDSWRSCSFKRAPFIHPGDSLLRKRALQKYISLLSGFDEYAKHATFAAKSDKTLHLGLLPVPFVGNLASASVFILLLNPGLTSLGYYAEESFEVRTALIQDIHQKVKGRYPFIYLDPKFAWYPGGDYWFPRFDGHVRRIMKKGKMDYFEALSYLAQSVCVLQLVPYHSRGFGLRPTIIERLASTQAIKHFVHQVILPQAHRGKAVLIVARRPKEWGIHEETENVVIYEGSERRAGYISPETRGGKKLIEFLGL